MADKTITTTDVDDDRPDLAIVDAIELLAREGYEIRRGDMKVQMTGDRSWKWVKI